MRNEQKRYFIQDGKKYDVFNLPKNFVVKGNIDISDMDLTELPDLSTVVVKGIFDCSRNFLTSLKGAPKEVDVFACNFNKLTSLEYGPKKARIYNCFCNSLKTLKGAPDAVVEFVCSYNQLKDLEGGPKEAKIYDCSKNNLISLYGAPKTQNIAFYSSGNDFVKNALAYRFEQLKQFLSRKTIQKEK